MPRLPIRTTRPATTLVGLLATLLAWAGPTHAQAPGYPATRRDSVVDDYHGVRVADPYRWLERLDDPATREWVSAQTGVTEAYLARIPGRDAIRRRLEALWSFPRTEVPWREAGRLFYVANDGRQRQPVLYSLAAPDGAPRVVLDPHTISPDGSIEVGDYAVSPDGRWLSYSASRGGADIGETRVRDLATGRDRADVVQGAWGEACWTFDGGGFFYMRPPPPAPGDSSGAARAGKQLYYHALGQPQSRDRLLRRWDDDVRWVYTMMSDDGRRAIVVAQRGENSYMSVMDLGHARAPDLSAPLVPLLAGHDVGNTPMGTVGDVLYVVTNLDAPRGRVIALDLRRGARAGPRTVIPESQDVIQNAIVAGDRLVLQSLHDVCSRLRMFALDGRGARDIALPGAGAIGWPLNGRHSAPELWYAFTSYLTPATVFRYDLARGRSTAFHPSHVPFDPAAYETRQVFFSSKDGTRVPMFVTARRGIALDGSHPVLLTGYGGFGTVFAPAYRADLPLWLEHGGIYAAANLRGGGEYGERWHRAGSGARKQASFDDFIAAAEYLVAHGYTRPGRLAIYGHSNGGLLIGAAITQRPDLFAAAVPNAGHYDMLRFHRFTVGAGWIPEYGSPDSAADFAVLRAYSPLHNVRAGTCYPATLLLAADHDDRVVPSHSYKFAAALQAAQACDAPVLLRVARNASHSYASDTEAIAEATDMWAFVAARIGVSLVSP